MKYDDSKSLQQQSQPSQPTAGAPQRALAPGKRPLTMGRSPQPAGAAAPEFAGAAAPVQRKPDPLSDPARSEQAELTRQWVNTAVRPDLYPPPAPRSRAAAVALKASESPFTGSLAASTASVSKMGEEGPRTASDIAQSGFSGPAAPIPYRSQMEQSFGRDFSNVRVYTDDAAARASASLGAHAYTMGDRIAFQSASPSQSLVAHELTHVVQQTGGGPAAHGGSSVAGIVTAGESQAEAVEAAVAMGQPAASVLDQGITEPGIARSGDGSKSNFAMGMTFSKDGFEKSYEYTIWERDMPPVPTPIPGVFWMLSPSVKVAGKFGANWGGEDEGSLQAAVEVGGSIGVGITGGAPGVAELYAVIEPGVSGSGVYKKSQDTWSLDVGMALKVAGKVGVKLAGGIVDYAFQLFDVELIKLTGINWDQDGFHPDRLGLAWGKDVQDILDSINSIIEKAKDTGDAIRDGAVEAGEYIADSVADAYEWLTSW